MTRELTLGDLRARSPIQRHRLWKNARRLLPDPKAARLPAPIEEGGLPFSEEGALAHGDPLALRMADVIWSPEGRRAALEAVQRGEPAMLGVDPLLRAAFGRDHGPHDQSTNLAGRPTGEVMRSMGYGKGPEKALPPSCVARTAATWRPPDRT